ncbi:class I SAM-dependent methyltransferase [Bacillus cereus group sp. BfR-BA-01310]|uniref:class I SAM-dependent methyltransferase n=1 Tax=Bacillus cereus group sp. BfR-BA-01310 TaxID=2920287 RepID=UPI001F59D40D|nr:class I SAM-dependent methyltransferase [Bacillus cereus group sp. BfR-BA-01310]
MIKEIDLHSVQGTMLIPLWGRANGSEKNKDILDDMEAIRIIKDCDFDFSKIADTFGEYGCITYIARARKIDDTIKQFISKHPNATIVNIGAGLDTTFSRVDNGTIHWYNLDLPDAISFRKTLIDDSPRNISIAKSFFNTSWFDDVKYDPKDGILFISAGVFYYFKEEELKKIIVAMAKRFPEGELYFDAESKFALKLSNATVKKSGNNGAMMHFHVNNPKAIEKWSSNIKVLSCSPFFKDIPTKKNWDGSTRIMMRIVNLIKMLKFVHLRFGK